MKPPKITYQAIAGITFLLVAMALVLGGMLPAKSSVASSVEQAEKKAASAKSTRDRHAVSLTQDEWARLVKSL